MLIYLEIALRLILAMCIGGGIGWERARRHHPAGIRTHMLVAIGAADRPQACLAARQIPTRHAWAHRSSRVSAFWEPVRS